jgi:hypothetical protein
LLIIGYNTDSSSFFEKNQATWNRILDVSPGIFPLSMEPFKRKKNLTQSTPRLRKGRKVMFPLIRRCLYPVGFEKGFGKNRI